MGDHKTAFDYCFFVFDERMLKTAEFVYNARQLFVFLYLSCVCTLDPDVHTFYQCSVHCIILYV